MRLEVTSPLLLLLLGLWARGQPGVRQCPGPRECRKQEQCPAFTSKREELERLAWGSVEREALLERLKGDICDRASKRVCCEPVNREISGDVVIVEPHEFVLSSPEVRLRITTSTGEDISGTRLGEKLFLRIEMDQESIFGIFARNLKAISGDNEDSIDLLDSRGCPTDPVIFPGLQTLPNSRDLQGSFEAFMFSDTSIVTFQVNVQFCVDACNPVECGDGTTSYGRRRREAEGGLEAMTQLPGTTRVPELYASRLVFDSNLGQEVISGNSQLSKQIIVDYSEGEEE